MESSSEREDKEIKPYAPVRRPACPFYGFDATFEGVMTDSGGNQCALKTKFYSPCQREFIGNMPSWLGCPLNTKKNRRKIKRNLEQIRMFPREFHPPKTMLWKGIPLEIWIIYTTGNVAIEDGN